MANRKADTSIDQLLNIIKQADGNNQLLNNLITALHKTIPVQRTKRRTIMADTNLNKTFTIKRINYSILGKVESRDDNMYNVRIISIVDGQSNFKSGDSLLISKRELEITGRPTSSKA